MPDPTFPYLGQGYQYNAPEFQEEVIASMQGLELWPGGVIVAPGSRPIRVGEVLARLGEDVTGLGKTGQFVPRKVTKMAADPGAASTVLDVDDAWPFAVGDVLVYDLVTAGTGTDLGTVASVDYANNKITLTANAPAGLADNDIIGVQGSGADTGVIDDIHTAVGIARLRYTPIAGVDVTGRMAMIIGGMLYADVVRGSGTNAPWRHGVESTNNAGGLSNHFPRLAGLDALATADLGAVSFDQQTGARPLVRIRAGT